MTTPRTGHPVVVIERGSPGRDVVNRYALPEVRGSDGSLTYRRLREAFHIDGRLLSRVMLRYPWGCFKRAGIRTMNGKPDGQEHKGNSFDAPLVMIENGDGALATQICDDIAWMADNCDEVILYHGNCNGLSNGRVFQTADYLRVRLPRNVLHAIDASSSEDDRSYNFAAENGLFLQAGLGSSMMFHEPLAPDDQRMAAGGWRGSVVQSHHLERNLDLLQVHRIQPHAGHRILIQLEGPEDLAWMDKRFGEWVQGTLIENGVERALAAGWDVGLRPPHLDPDAPNAVPDSVREACFAGTTGEAEELGDE